MNYLRLRLNLPQLKVSLERIEWKRLLADNLPANLRILHLLLLEALYPLKLSLGGLAGDQDKVVALADEIVPGPLPSDFGQTESIPNIQRLRGDDIFINIPCTWEQLERHVWVLPSSSEESLSPTTNWFLEIFRWFTLFLAYCNMYWNTECVPF